MRLPLPAGCAFLTLILSGCAQRAPNTYRLTERFLVPPRVAGPGVTHSALMVEASGNANCRRAGDGIRIERRGKKLRVAVERGQVADRPAGWLAAWTLALEDEGCLAPGEGLALSVRILESLPLDPTAAYRLIHADDRLSSYLDLGPENRLEVDSPVLREGAPPDAPIIESAKITGLTVEVKASANLLGFERSWYGIAARTAGPGFGIAPLYAEDHVEGKVERRNAPRTNYCRFRPDAAFYRILYRGDRSLVLLSAATRVELARNTEALKKNPGACETFPAGSCAIIPRDVSVNADIIASVKGQEIALPVGATVASAIRATGDASPRLVVPTLSVTRLYAGKPTPVEFDREREEILGLVLVGGEEISWK